MATSQGRSDLPDAERELLYVSAGGRCSFPGCEKRLVRPGEGRARAVNIGELAHIVAASRQGPRGGHPLDDVERDARASNRILLCPSHHTEIDKEPLIYTVEVLRQMKDDHEARHRGAEAEAEVIVDDVPERLHSSLLPVIGLPVVVESASVKNPKLSEGEIAASLKYTKEWQGIVFPFIVRDGRLWTFSHLRQKQHPFGPVVDSDYESVDLMDLERSDEGHRRVVGLLNRAVGRHLGMRQVRFDRDHQRYWFLADRDYETGVISDRTSPYVTKTGRRVNRPVVHHAHRRDGQAKDEWYHEAARLRFERFDQSWFLSVRPEFHLTVNGVDPMPSHRIGRKVTRKKSHLYNAGYLDRLWFWRHFLSDGGPRLSIKAGEQSILIDAEYASTSVHWPGIPNDTVDVRSGRAAETLFTIQDLADDDPVEDWWDDEDDDEDGDD